MIRQNWSTLKKLMFMKTAAGGGAAVEATATGNPLTFLTDLAKPLKSLLIPFTPIQQGTGDPSPSNVRNIVPWNGLKVWNGGKNLLTSMLEQGTIVGATGAETSNPARVRTKDYIVLPAGTYTVSAVGVNSVMWYLYNLDGTYNRAIGWKNTLPNTMTLDGYYRVRFAFRKSANDENITPADVSNVQLEVGEPATSYEAPHITETDIVFPSPVYGGILSVVSGVLRVQWAGFSATWGDGASATDIGSGITRKIFPMVDYLSTGSANNICNIAPYKASADASVHFYYSGSGTTNRNCRLFLPSDTPDTTEITVITKLSQAQEIQLTPQQITALVGNNTLWSDADGSMIAIYLKKG